MSNFFEWVGWDYGTIVACAVGFIACVTFVTNYWRRAGRDAWRNRFGRFLLQRKTLSAVLFAYVLVGRWFGGVDRPDAYTAQDFLGFCIFLGFALHTFVPYRLLIEAQRAPSDQEEAQHDAR